MSRFVAHWHHGIIITFYPGQERYDTTQVDGALGVSGDSVGDVFAVLGTATSGTQYPVAFVNPQDIINYFGSGPLVEHACYLAGGKPVVCVRMDTNH